MHSSLSSVVVALLSLAFVPTPNFSGEQALRIVASKYVPATNGKPFYKTVEADLKGKPKHEIEQAVLDFVEQHSEDPVVCCMFSSHGDRLCIIVIVIVIAIFLVAKLNDPHIPLPPLSLRPSQRDVGVVQLWG